MQRLHDVDGGRILIDGQDIAAVTQDSLRRQVAIVQQEPMLFHRSLAENIAYGRPEASREKIRAAARMAHADAFIMRQPKGYATLVGERGVKLSGGERQRVALARAFLADTPILILDEATSSLDSESEALIQDAMERLSRPHDPGDRASSLTVRTLTHPGATRANETAARCSKDGTAAGAAPGRRCCRRAVRGVSQCPPPGEGKTPDHHARYRRQRPPSHRRASGIGSPWDASRGRMVMLADIEAERWRAWSGLHVATRRRDLTIDN